MPVSPDNHHVDQIQSAIASNGAAKSALIASWRRSSILHRLDPTGSDSRRRDGFRVRRARQEVEPLIRVAQAEPRQTPSVGRGSGLLCPARRRNGIPVERRGAPGDDATFSDWGLWPGTIWSEDSVGTNGIGTCLVEQRALTIHRDQHFLSAQHIAQLHDRADP